jgi:hypothetical protein
MDADAGSYLVPFGGLFDRQLVPWYGLEMHVVGCGGSAVRTVVEEGVAVDETGYAEHVGKASVYLLSCMLKGRDGEVPVEDRIRINAESVGVDMCLIGSLFVRRSGCCPKGGELMLL